MHRLLSRFTLLVVFAACGSDSGPVPVTLANMAGSWEATEIRYTDYADTTNTRDVLTFFGISVGATIRDDGRVILLVSGQAPDTSFATLAGDVMTIQGVRFTVSLSGNTMHWVGLDTLRFDLEPDGTLNDVHQRWDWLRN